MSGVRDRRRAAAVLAAGLAGVLLLGGCSGPTQESPVSNVTVQDEDGMNGAVPVEPYPVADVTLTATDGSPYRLAGDTDKPLTLMFFGYTSCPDICQVVMADIASALVRLDPAEREQVGMLFVTTDPARDDELALRDYLDRFDPTFEGLTGSLSDIKQAGESVAVHVARGAKMPSGGYEVEHGTHVVGMSPDGTAPIVWTEGTAPEKIAEDIQVILAEGGVPTGDTE